MGNLKVVCLHFIMAFFTPRRQPPPQCAVCFAFALIFFNKMSYYFDISQIVESICKSNTRAHTYICTSGDVGSLNKLRFCWLSAFIVPFGQSCCKLRMCSVRLRLRVRVCVCGKVLLSAKKLLVLSRPAIIKLSVKLSSIPQQLAPLLSTSRHALSQASPDI